MEAVSKLSLRVAPRKARAVVDVIRGQELTKAIYFLQNSSRIVASSLIKLLKSAQSNWEQKHQAEHHGATLFILKVWVDAGGCLKRVNPAPQGRAHTIRKRSGRITVIVGDKAPHVNLATS